MLVEISSLKWVENGTGIVIGDNQGNIKLWQNKDKNNSNDTQTDKEKENTAELSMIDVSQNAHCEAINSLSINHNLLVSASDV